MNICINFSDKYKIALAYIYESDNNNSIIDDFVQYYNYYIEERFDICDTKGFIKDLKLKKKFKFDKFFKEYILTNYSFCVECQDILLDTFDDLYNDFKNGRNNKLLKELCKKYSLHEVKW